MIKLRKDTLSENKGKRKTTPDSRSQMEMELNFLIKLKETDKSHVPEALDILDEGHLTFVKKEFFNFVREADLNIREYVNERSLKKHKSNFLEVVRFNLYNDEQLLKSFKWSAEKCGTSTKDVKSNVIDKVYSDMFHKLCNTRTKEFFRGKFEKDLATSGKVVEADQSLRDNLKTFSVAKKRYTCIFCLERKFQLCIHVYTSSAFLLGLFLVNHRPPIGEGEILREDFPWIPFSSAHSY